MKNSKIPGLNAPFDLKGSVNKIEMMMSSGKVKKSGYRVEKMMTGIDKEMNIDEKVFKNINMNTEMIGWNRLNKQKGLSLFGDIDGDKVANIFDCKPFDKMEQGLIHKLKRFVAGEGFTEPPPPPQKVGGLEVYGEKIIPKVEIYEQPKKKKFITVTQVPSKPKMGVIKEAEEVAKTPWTEKAEKFGYAVGLLKTPEQRLEIEKRRVESAKARTAEKIAIAKATPRQPPVVVRDRAGRMVRRVMPYPTREISPAQKASGVLGLAPSVGFMTPSYGMSGVGFGQMVSGRSPGIGGGFSQMMSSRSTGGKVGFDYMITGKEMIESPVLGAQPGVQPGVQPPPAAYPISSPGVQPSVPYGVQAQPGYPPQVAKKYSPYSKRQVEYTRGPYKKRTVVVQPGPSQYAQPGAPQYAY